MFRIFFSMIFIFLFLHANEPISPIPIYVEYDSKKANLGKKLFFDTRLSVDNTISCSSCHILKDGGDDNLQFSFGVKGQEGNINAPTVLNSRYNFRQFWDGRAKDLSEQVSGPIENPIEMAYNFPDLIKRLKASEYKALFNNIYEDGISKKSIIEAIVEYEKTLITPNSDFDRFLRGDKNAITKIQEEGYELFKAKGCISCHHGINVGGNLYNKFGVVQDAKSSSLGRYNVTKRVRDKYYFKVPSLRNIARTAPYFHDGRTNDLNKAIRIMAQLQLGRFISDEDIDKIEAFLNSLSADVLYMGEVK